MNSTIHRRTFLRASGVALALPLLDSMNPTLGRAIAEPPKRMVLICTALGLHSPALFPKTTGAEYESTEYLDLLKQYRRDFTLFAGLSHPDQGGEHATEMTWLSAARNPGQDGFRNSISVDQLAATSLGYVTRFPSVSLSSKGPSSQSYTSSGVMVPAESSPARMFAKMFLQGDRQQVRRQKRKLSEGRSILDELMSQTKTLRNNASSADRKRLDEYFDALRVAEKDLAEAQVWLDKPKPSVDEEPPKDVADRADLVGRTELLMKLIPLIVQSDSSRVISVVIQDHQVVPLLNGVSFEHHNLSHHGRDEAKIKQLKTIEKALLNCFGDLLGQMKSKREGATTILDNTMVMFGSNLGNANAHDPRNLPILLAGGGFQHGSYVAFRKNDNMPLCNLFVSMLNKMNVETDSFATSSGQLSW
ncbi:MAG TPA: DUF1552 domain-containing protein [Planctomycetaceae bacterium]|nr:DUF1552 domain-containing protein [Planctomycetaceae bacterium]